MNDYTIKADGYQIRTISAINEVYARDIFMFRAGWLSDMAGYRDLHSALLVTPSNRPGGTGRRNRGYEK